PRDLGTVCADATQLYQALMNLCLNARDAMPRGGRLTITAETRFLDEHYGRMRPEARPGRYVLLTVADTGPGVPADALDKVFDPFLTAREPGQGTGLGLAAVAGIVKNHGGFVSVHSEPGKGTAFTVYLPAVEAG